MKICTKVNRTLLALMVINGFALCFFASIAAAQSVQKTPPVVSGGLSQDAPPASSGMSLTQTMIDHTREFFEWVVEAPFTEAQRRVFEQDLTESVGRGEIKTDFIVQVEQWRDKFNGLPLDQRSVLLRKFQDRLIPQFRAQVNSRVSQILVQIYDSAHQPLVPGQPPLTRQVSDSFAEIFSFMISAVVSGTPVEANQAIKDEMAREMIKSYPTLTPDQQKGLATMPLVWSVLRTSWPKLNEAQQENLRAQWRNVLAAYLSPSATAGAVLPSPNRSPDSQPPSNVSRTTTPGRARPVPRSPVASAPGGGRGKMSDAAFQKMMWNERFKSWTTLNMMQTIAHQPLAHIGSVSAIYSPTW